MAEYQLLGEVGILVDGAPGRIGGARARRLLGVLLLSEGRVVSLDRIMEAVWAESPPANAVDTLRTYVARLRKALAEADTALAGDLQTVQNGYRIDCNASVDATRFESALAQARTAASIKDHQAAIEALVMGLELWSGPALGEFADEEWAVGDATRLNLLRVDAEELLVQSRINVGEGATVLADLERLIAEHPLRENFRSQRMTALHQVGRTTEAIREFSAFSDFLAEESGLEPSPKLVELEARILSGESLLSVEIPPVRGYEVTGVLGAGSLGTTHLAVQPTLNREVALKTIATEVADSPSYVQTFASQAQGIGGLTHPNIVPLLDAWREPGRAYQVSLYLHGGSLADRLHEHFQSGTLLGLVKDLCFALASAHQQGVSHRNIKPSNILFDESGNAFLSDFAIVPNNGFDVDLSVARGSYSYGESQIDPAADVFALGMVLCHAATGVGPVPSSTEAPAIRYRRELEQRRCSPELVGLLTRAIDVRRNRFRDGVEMAEHIESNFGTSAVEPEARAHATDDIATAAIRVADALGSDESNRHSVNPTNPFKGLFAFHEHDAQDFHGREAVVGSVLKRLDEEGFVAIVGPSGSGKSSVVGAGVIPRRRSDGDYIVWIVPGEHPFDELETALLRIAPLGSGGLRDRFLESTRGVLRAITSVLPDQGRCLLVVDQFEELFTMTGEVEREQFLCALAEIATDQRSRIDVVVTIRADFFDRPLSSPAIGPHIRDHTLALTPMDVDELSDAIVLPLEAAGVTIEPSTVSRVIADLHGNSASLPLLQYAMTQLFEQQTDGLIGAAEYEEIGGLAGALSRRADEILAAMPTLEQQAARRLFMRLVTPGEGVEDTRRRAQLSQLPSVPPATIEAFADARLLAFDHDPQTREPTVEVAHEALIREWPQLRTWIDADRDKLRALRHLSNAAGVWEADGRKSDELYRGGRLDTAVELGETDADSLTGLEQEFIEASSALRKQQIDAERRQLTRLRQLLIGAVCLLILSMVAGSLAFQQRGRANDQADRAESASRGAETRRLVAQAGLSVGDNRRIGLLLAAEAARREPSSETLGALQRALVGADNLLGIYGGSAAYRAVEFTNDGNLIAADDTGISIFDIDTGSTLLRIDQFGAEDLLLTADGSTVAVTTTDSSVHLFDMQTGASNGPSIRNETDITATVFTADEKGVIVGDRRGMVRVFDRATGDMEIEFLAHPEVGLGDVEGLELDENLRLEVAHEPTTFLVGVTTMSLSPDGSQLLTAGGVNVRLWDLSTQQQLLSEIVSRSSTRTGDRVADPPIVARWVTNTQFDVVTAFELQRWNAANVDVRSSAALLPSRSIGISLQSVNPVLALTEDLGVMVGADGSVISFDEAGEAASRSFNSQLSGLVGLAIQDGNRKLAIASDDGIGLFSLDGSRIIGDAVPSGRGEITMNADATLLSVSSPFGDEPELWDIADRKNPRLIEPLEDGTQFAWVAGKRLVVTWSIDDVTVDIRSAETLKPLFSIEPLTLFATAINRTETLVALGLDATITEEPIVVVVDTEQQRVVARLEDLSGVDDRTLVRAVAFSNDGTRLVAATLTGAAMVWDTATWKPVGPVLSSGGGAVLQAAYSNNDEWLVTIAQDGSISYRDTETYQPTGPVFLGNNDAVGGFSYGPFFSDDGRYMITTADVLGRLWDIEQGVQIGGPFPSERQSIPHVSRDGSTLATVWDGYAVLWDLNTDTWLERACQAAGRNFTLHEWRQFGPTDEPYAITCPQWPSELSEQEQQDLEQDNE